MAAESLGEEKRPSITDVRPTELANLIERRAMDQGCSQIVCDGSHRDLGDASYCDAVEHHGYGYVETEIVSATLSFRHRDVSCRRLNLDPSSDRKRCTSIALGRDPVAQTPPDVLVHESIPCAYNVVRV